MYTNEALKPVIYSKLYKEGYYSTTLDKYFLTQHFIKLFNC